MPSIQEVSAFIDNSNYNLRKTYLKQLAEHSDRNVIAYYADWFSEKNVSSTIDDDDLHGFMSSVYKLNKRQGLDLILHTPGGDPTAAEAIVTYLRSIFGNDIRAIVPHMAMSAGTMLACACKEIVMGKHSSLGPIDPQFYGMPAIDIVSEYDKAKEELLSNPASIRYWQILLAKYPAAFYERCTKAIELSEQLVKTWLETNMLKEKSDSVDRVLRKLNENKQSKTHSRHFDKEQCKEAGLTIIDLEDDDVLQELVLSIHHCYMHFFNHDKAGKIIENHLGRGIINV